MTPSSEIASTSLLFCCPAEKILHLRIGFIKKNLSVRKLCYQFKQTWERYREVALLSAGKMFESISRFRIDLIKRNAVVDNLCIDSRRDGNYVAKFIMHRTNTFVQNIINIHIRVN